MTAQFESLLVVSLAAFAAPLLLGLVPGSRIPTIVGEVSAGVVLGRSGLELIETGPWLDFLFLFGLAFLLFLAGLEVDFGAIRTSARNGWRAVMRSPVGLGVIGIAMRLALAFVVTVPLTLAGLLDSPTLVAFLLTSTSLGVVLTVLGERRILSEPYGQLILVNAAIADFGTVLLLTTFFSADPDSTTGARLALIGLLIVFAVVLVIALRRIVSVARVAALVDRLGGATTQVPIRASFALLLVFVVLADRFGLEVILGAFIAGAIVSTLAGPANPEYEGKIEAVGYGFFVPVFFVLTGARIDLDALAASGETLALVPILLVAVFAVKAAPAWLYRNLCTPRECAAAGFLQAAQMTITVAGVEIGKSLGLIDDALGSALIIVALLSVLIAPIVFSALYGAREPEAAGRA